MAENDADALRLAENCARGRLSKFQKCLPPRLESAFLAEIPRIPLGTFPTPLVPLERLSTRLGVDLWMKRDDCSGVALGGNKTRKLEYVLADARAKGFTSVVTTAHGVLDMEKALAFYYGPLHMTVFIESVLKGPETNRALCLPPHCETRSVLVQGAHEYGKVALASDLRLHLRNLNPA